MAEMFGCEIIEHAGGGRVYRTMAYFGTDQLDDPASQGMRECLGLPTILRKILEHFSDNELIQLSLVNKLWNFEARSVMRDRGTLSADISFRSIERSGNRVVGSRGHPCHLLVDFASDLAQMRVVPFTGIRIPIIHYHLGCHLFSNRLLNPFYKVILDRLPWKHLTVNLTDMFDKELPIDCPAIVFAQQVLEEYGDVLENLTLLCQNSTDIEAILLDRSLQCLKTLSIRPHGPTRSYVGPIKMLVSRAPNLQKLNVFKFTGFPENVLEGSSAVLVTQDFYPLASRHPMPDSLISVLRAEKLHIHTHWANSYVQLLTTYVPKILQSCRTSLHSLDMDLPFALPLMCYGIRLENVTELEISLSDDSLTNIEPIILEMAKRFDFTRLFPKLNQVRIEDDSGRDYSPDLFSEFIEQGRNLLGKTLPDRAINIQQMKFRELGSDSWDSTFPLLAQVFPNVKTFEFNMNQEQQSPFTLIWENFMGLEELTVNYTQEGDRRVGNLDSIFCGIFPKEAVELSRKDDEYLKAVNIVPVMPSIRCLADLRTFTLRFKLKSHEYAPWRLNYRPTYWFSKVTGLIGFARCPGLTVKFQPTSPHGEALGHMRPYVRSYTVVAEDDESYDWNFGVIL